MEEQTSLIYRLHLIRSEVGKMQKDGYNDFQKYKYLSESQVTEYFKELLVKHKVDFSIDAEIISQTILEKNILTHVRIKYRFSSVDDPKDFMEGIMDGQGIDKGDKGVYKAITGAVKYIFMKNFLIPTGDDPEVANELDKEKKKEVDYSKVKKNELEIVTDIVEKLKNSKSKEDIKTIVTESREIELSDSAREVIRQEGTIKIKELNKNA